MMHTKIKGASMKKRTEICITENISLKHLEGLISKHKIYLISDIEIYDPKSNIEIFGDFWTIGKILNLKINFSHFSHVFIDIENKLLLNNNTRKPITKLLEASNYEEVFKTVIKDINKLTS